MSILGAMFKGRLETENPSDLSHVPDNVRIEMAARTAAWAVKHAEMTASARVGDGHCAHLDSSAPYRREEQWLPGQLADKSAEQSAGAILASLFARAVGAALPDSWKAQEFAAGGQPSMTRKERAEWSDVILVCREQFDAGMPITGSRAPRAPSGSDNRFAALAALRSAA